MIPNDLLSEFPFIHIYLHSCKDKEAKMHENLIYFLVVDVCTVSAFIHLMAPWVDNSYWTYNEAIWRMDVDLHCSRINSVAALTYQGWWVEDSDSLGFCSCGSIPSTYPAWYWKLVELFSLRARSFIHSITIYLLFSTHYSLLGLYSISSDIFFSVERAEHNARTHSLI